MSAQPIPPIRDADRERFLSKVAEGKDGCRVWTGAKDSSGYGMFWLAGRMFKAHRVAIRIAGYAMPTFLVVDHICRNRACVNHEHLRSVDRHTNVHENSQAPSHLNSLKTHCPKGHEYTGDNTIVRRNGSRSCKSCQAEWQRLRRERTPVQQKQSDPKTHCPRGHEYSGENLLLKQGRRKCRQCHLQELREYRLRRKAQGLPAIRGAKA